MATTVAELQAAVTADISNFESELQRAEQMLQSFAANAAGYLQQAGTAISGGMQNAFSGVSQAAQKSFDEVTAGIRKVSSAANQIGNELLGIGGTFHTWGGAVLGTYFATPVYTNHHSVAYNYTSKLYGYMKNSKCIGWAGNVIDDYSFIEILGNTVPAATLGFAQSTGGSGYIGALDSNFTWTR